MKTVLHLQRNRRRCVAAVLCTSTLSRSCRLLRHSPSLSLCQVRSLVWSIWMSLLSRLHTQVFVDLFSWPSRINSPGTEQLRKHIGSGWPPCRKWYRFVHGGINEWAMAEWPVDDRDLDYLFVLTQRRGQCRVEYVDSDHLLLWSRHLQRGCHVSACLLLSLGEEKGSGDLKSRTRWQSEYGVVKEWTSFIAL